MAKSKGKTVELTIQLQRPSIGVAVLKYRAVSEAKAWKVLEKLGFVVKEEDRPIVKSSKRVVGEN